MEIKIRRAIKSRTLDRIREEFLPGHQLRGRYFCAILDGNIVGCIGLRRASWFLTEIYHVFVCEDHRNQGIGNLLVQKAIDASRTPLVSVTIREDNHASLRLFDHLKFFVSEHFLNEGHYVLFLTRKKDLPPQA